MFVVMFVLFVFFFFFFLLGIYSRLFSAAEAVWLLFFCSIRSKPGTVFTPDRTNSLFLLFCVCVCLAFLDP